MPLLELSIKFLDLGLRTFFFFQFPNGIQVVSILRQILTQLETLFQGTLQTVANRHKCDNAFAQKINFIAVRKLFY
jgi:hypothetical protein